MNRVKVESITLTDLGKFVKNENDKLLEIITNIIDISIDYEDMMISETGELFREYIIKEQNQEKEKINLYNQNIAEKLSLIANIYTDTNDKIGGLMK